MRVIRLTFAWVVVSLAAQLEAHENHTAAWNRPGALSAWDLAVLAVLTMTAILYIRGVRQLRRRDAEPPVRHRVAFACGWITLVAVTLPPIDALAIQLFSIHMIQHELMMLVGAPLLIASRPLSTCLWGLPGAWRRDSGTLIAAAPVRSVWRATTMPVVAWALHGLAIWIWHIPQLYDAAVANEGVHALQHAMFVSTAALFWWGLIAGRYGRAGYGAAVFYVFTTVVHTGLLGAMLTFAPIPLYPAYIGTAASRGIDPLADQQAAGLLMWLPAGTILSVLGIALFAAWLGESARRQRQITSRPSG